jgi:hypothetical protein
LRSHEHQLAAREGPSVVLVLEGRGRVGGVSVESGNAVFVPHNTAVELQSESSNAAPQRFRVFVAMVNLTMKRCTCFSVLKLPLWQLRPTRRL